MSEYKEIGGIPIYLFDEHNEAFFYWFMENLKKPLPDTLIHIDAHRDFYDTSCRCAYGHARLKTRKEKLKWAAEYARELRIDSFIKPAILNGFFSKVTSVYPDWRFAFGQKEKYRKSLYVGSV